MTIFVYKKLTRNPEMENNLDLVLSFAEYLETRES